MILYYGVGLLIGSLIALTLFGVGRWQNNKRIKDLVWDQQMQISQLNRVAKRYFRMSGWKVNNRLSDAEIRIELGESKFIVRLYTSDMPQFYDNEKITNYILSETRTTRRKETIPLLVVSMFDLPDYWKENLQSEKIFFTFYANLKQL